MEYLSSAVLGVLNIGNRPTFMIFVKEAVLHITLCSNRVSHELTNRYVPDDDLTYINLDVFTSGTIVLAPSDLTVACHFPNNKFQATPFTGRVNQGGCTTVSYEQS